jgi:hypothetical protein
MHQYQQSELLTDHKIPWTNQIHCIFKAVGGTSYQPSCDATSFCFFVSRRHTHSTWTHVPIPPSHPTSHPWSLQGSYLAVVDTDCNTSWLGLLRLWHLEFHGVLLNIWRSISCPREVHWIHQLNKPSLGFVGKSLEERLGINRCNLVLFLVGLWWSLVVVTR